MSHAGERRGAGRGSAQEDETLVVALGRVARDVAASDDGRAGPPPSVWHELARARTQRSRPSGASRGWWTRWPVAAAVGFACAAIAVVGGVRWRDGGHAGSSGGLADRGGLVPATADATGVEGAPLTFAVAGATLGSGDEIDAAGRSNAEVRFSDGTDIGLFEGARLAVAGRYADGARLRLRSGRARFQVVHRPRAAWTVDAGPYVIEVTGTVFDVRWSEVDQTIEVRMQSGSVRVSGPLLSERMPLRTGQHLVVRPAEGDVRIDDGRSTGEGTEAPRAPEPPAASGPEGAAAIERPIARQVSEAGPAQPGVGPGVVLHPRPSPAAVATTEPQPLAALGRPRARAHLALARAPSTAPRPASGRLGGDTPSGPSVEPASPSVEPPSMPAPGWTPPPRSPGGGPSGQAAVVPAAAAQEVREVQPGATARAETPPGLWRERRWAAQVAAGDSQAVVADAERLGLEATLSGADSQSLSALADAARYAGRPELADKALIEERRRFPGGARAQAAAFLLGRAADDRGDIQGGLAWYRRYLIEAPRGPYSAEALGREMLAIERLQGRSAAAPLAADYLRRFPNGTYLLRARALLDDR